MFRRKEKIEKSGSFIPQRGTEEFVVGRVETASNTYDVKWEDNLKLKYELIKCPLSCVDFTPDNGFFIKDLGKKDKIFIEGFEKKINEGYKVHSFNIFGSHVYFLLEFAS